MLILKQWKILLCFQMWAIALRSFSYFLQHFLWTKHIFALEEYPNWVFFAFSLNKWYNTVKCYSGFSFFWGKFWIEQEQNSDAPNLVAYGYLLFSTLDMRFSIQQCQLNLKFVDLISFCAGWSTRSCKSLGRVFCKAPSLKRRDGRLVDIYKIDAFLKYIRWQVFGKDELQIIFR